MLDRFCHRKHDRLVDLLTPPMPARTIADLDLAVHSSLFTPVVPGELFHHMPSLWKKKSHLRVMFRSVYFSNECGDEDRRDIPKEGEGEDAKEAASSAFGHHFVAGDFIVDKSRMCCY